MKKALVIFSKASTVVSNWILATGFWADSGEWDDSDVWID